MTGDTFRDCLEFAFNAPISLPITRASNDLGWELVSPRGAVQATRLAVTTVVRRGASFWEDNRLDVSICTLSAG